VELEEIADELYRLPPEEFIAARKQRETAARADGDRELAAEIARLGKPSTAAWVANLLAYEQPDEVAQLVELGGLLREAQDNLAGDELKALDVQRRKLVAALTRQARALAYEQGHRVSTGVADQVEETLRAAMVDPDAGAALVAGHLTTALSYSGLGTPKRADLRVVAPPRDKPAPARARKEAPARTRSGEESAAQRRAREKAEAERRAAEQRRRRQLEEARAALDEAAAAAVETAAAEEAERATLEELRERAQRLEARIEELAEELDRVREEHTEVGHERSRAERRHSAAQRRAGDAARARDRARRHLDELEK
jgi:hypothetical protein